MDQFNVGEIVCLQSGGAEMTIVGLRGDGVVNAAWTDDDGVPHEVSYHGDCVFSQDKE